MFTNMHIAKTNAIESQIEMELLFLSESTQAACLELIMSLAAEVRITYLNQFMQRVTAMAAETVSFETESMEWLQAAWFPHNKKVLTLIWDGWGHLFLLVENCLWVVFGRKKAVIWDIKSSKWPSLFLISWMVQTLNDVGKAMKPVFSA